LTTRIILDITRTLLRAANPAPTGIDRVELAYALHLMRRVPDRLTFSMLAPGLPLTFPPEVARPLILDVAEAWSNGAPRGTTRAWRSFAPSLLRQTMRRAGPRHNVPGVFLLVSHLNLNRGPLIAARLRRHAVRFVCLIHDLIPIEFPEYVRPAESERHRQRLETVLQHADGILVNSAATRDALLPYLDRTGRQPELVVAPLGVEPHETADPPPPHLQGVPYFVCVGTIEPRKNHLLLLHLWRRLATEGHDRPPRLVLVGRRGWENENIIDLVERSTPLKGHVEEYSGLSDRQVRALIGGARALLMPSFAEGYGLPLAEALMLGTPALCSNIPALVEVGQGLVEHLEPLDGPAWRQAVLDYAAPGSPRRAAQIARIAAWVRPSWERHIDIALNLVNRIAA
jgi:glycosyltransferase involved in cell wall biosynthesis